MDWSSGMLSLVSLFAAHPHGVLLAIACVLTSYAFYRAWTQKVPAVNWPLVGMLPALLTLYPNLHEQGPTIFAEFKSTYWFRGPWFLGMDMLFTCDPANVNHMFITHASFFPKGKEYLEIFDIFGGALIGSNDGESCRTQRKLVHALLSSQSFRRYELHACRSKAEKALLPLLRRMAEQKKVVDLQDVFERLTFDISSALFLGVDPDALGDEEVRLPRAMRDIEEVLVFRHMVPKFCWKTLRWLKLGPEKKLAASYEEVDRFAREAIAKRKESIDKGRKEQQDDLLSAYLQIPAEQRKNLPEFNEYIKDNALNLLLASSDTTAAALTWFTWLMCTHPAVEQKVLQELEENWPRAVQQDQQHVDTLDRDRIGKLVYLHAAICESLRLFPPASLQHKEVTTAGTLPSGDRVKPGDVVIVHLYSMARMEGIWGKDCKEFKPERWITESGEIRNEPAYKFFSFGSGPRICLGRELAFTKLKTVIASLLRNFRFEVVEGHEVALNLSVISYMRNGLLVNVRKRERNWQCN